MGRRTLPDAKRKFTAGLPPGSHFYVTTVLTDANGRWEQSFVLVRKIDEGGLIYGSIANDLSAVAGRAAGDELTLGDEDIRDWDIVAADGSEEGNYVGRFLDYYRPGKMFVVVFGLFVSEDGQANQVRFALLTDESRKRLNFDVPPDWLDAATRVIKGQRWPARDAKGNLLTAERFVPVIYDPENPSLIRTPP